MTDELHKQTSYQLAEIWQFPVKGFPGQHYQSVTLQTDQLLPADRRYAVSNGHPASHKKLAEGWLSKRHFVQLLSEARLAGLSLKIDEESGRISLSDNSGARSDAPLDEARSGDGPAAGPVARQICRDSPVCAVWPQAAIPTQTRPGSHWPAARHWLILPNHTNRP